MNAFDWRLVVLWASGVAAVATIGAAKRFARRQGGKDDGFYTAIYAILWPILAMFMLVVSALDLVEGLLERRAEKRGRGSTG